MTEEGATEEPLTEEIIRDRWESLTVDADFFEGCRKHAINLIFAENYERKIYFFECENIDFQNELGETIWSTSGNGQMDLPARVGVRINRGRLKHG